MGGSRDQKRVDGRIRQLAVREQAFHVTQADEGLAYAHGHGGTDQPMALDYRQNVVLQGLFFRLKRISRRTSGGSAHKQGISRGAGSGRF